MSEQFTAGVEQSKIPVRPNSDAEELTQQILSRLNDSWNWFIKHSEEAIDFLTINDLQLVITKSWYGDAELDGMSVFFANEEYQTEDAIFFNQIENFDARHQEPHCQTRINSAWIPKSVIQVRVVPKEVEQ